MFGCYGEQHTSTLVGAKFHMTCELVQNVFLVVMSKLAQASMNIKCWLVNFVDTNACMIVLVIKLESSLTVLLFSLLLSTE